MKLIFHEASCFKVYQKKTSVYRIDPKYWDLLTPYHTLSKQIEY